MQADETHNQDFENIDFHNFKPVDYPRKMSWRKRTGAVGRVATGPAALTNQNVDEDMDDMVLEAGWIVVVHKMEFKLVKG